jgi:hypothetical protein
MTVFINFRHTGSEVDYIANLRHAVALLERKYSEFVSVNLDPGLPSRKLYNNLRRLGVINGPERFNGDVDVERLSSCFLTWPVYYLMSIKSNAAVVDEVLLSFNKSLLPVLLGTLTHVFNHIFTCSAFPAR